MRHGVRSTHDYRFFYVLKHTLFPALYIRGFFYTGISGAIAGEQSCGIKKKRLFFSPPSRPRFTFEDFHRSVSRRRERSRCIFNVLTLDVACFFGGSYYFCVRILLKKAKKDEIVMKGRGRHRTRCYRWRNY